MCTTAATHAERGTRLLQTAVSPGAMADVDVYAAAMYGRTDEVRRYLDGGRDVNARLKPGNNTPLHFAAGCGRTDVVQLLIASNADSGNAETSVMISPRPTYINSNKTVSAID